MIHEIYLFLVAANSFARITENISKRPGADPLIFLEASNQISMHFKKRLHYKGIDGAMYVITTKFAEECYWKGYIVAIKAKQTKGLVMIRENIK